MEFQQKRIFVYPHKVIGIKPIIEQSAELHFADYFIESSYKVDGIAKVLAEHDFVVSDYFIERGVILCKNYKAENSAVTKMFIEKSY